jgi:hypothetical protein
MEEDRYITNYESVANIHSYKVVLFPMTHKGTLPKNEHFAKMPYYQDKAVIRGIEKVARHSIRLGETIFLTKPAN